MLRRLRLRRHRSRARALAHVLAALDDAAAADAGHRPSAPPRRRTVSLGGSRHAA